MLRFCVLIAGFSSSALPSTAQSPSYTRQELTLGAAQPTGPSLRYTWNFSPNFAVETKLTGWPSPLTSGEDSMALLAGVKAGVRRGRWNFFGTLTPGWGLRPDSDIQYTSTIIGGVTFIYPAVDRPILRSHFILQTGLGAQYSFTPRFFLRGDVTSYLEPTFAQQQFNDLVISISSSGYIENHVALELAAGYRLGRLRTDADPLSPHHSTFDLGALYSLHLRAHLLEQDVTADSGVGGWISWNASRWLSVEAAALHSPHDDHTENYQDGGPETLAVAGVKAGLRRDRFGVFAKLRPGAVRFANGLASETILLSNFNFSSHPIYQPALDTGGVVEYYPGRHFLLRAEGGDALIFYRPRTILYNGSPVSGGSQGTTSTLLLLFGGGVRF